MPTYPKKLDENTQNTEYQGDKIAEQNPVKDTLAGNTSEGCKQRPG